MSQRRFARSFVALPAKSARDFQTFRVLSNKMTMHRCQPRTHRYAEHPVYNRVFNSNRRSSSHVCADVRNLQNFSHIHALHELAALVADATPADSRPFPHSLIKLIF